LREIQAIKNPLVAGFFSLSVALTAQAIAVIAVVRLADNQRGLQGSNVASCRAFSAVFDGEGNFLTFIQRFVTISHDSREVNEQVFRTVVRSDEAEAFVSVEPFYDTSHFVRHSDFL